MPEIVPELREEIRTVLAEQNNTFCSLALQNMKKLDSFLKETLRFHPASSGECRVGLSDLLPTSAYAEC